MAYVFWSLSVVSLILATGKPFATPLLYNALTCQTVLYFTRSRWLPQTRERISTIPLPTFPTFNFYRYAPLPTSFQGDVEAGLHSTTFDITDNIVGGDERSGLDEAGKREVLRIMKRRGVGFDEARRMWMEERFKKEGIGKDGVPRDPKFVSFS